MAVGITIPKSASPLIRMAVICLAGLAAFVALAIYPNANKMKALDAQALKLQATIEKQKVLHPLYLQIQKMVDGIQHPDAHLLPTQKVTPLTSGEIHAMPLVLRSIIEKSGLKVEAIEPEVNTLIDSSDRMRVTIAASGAFARFRDLYLGLGEELASLVHVERVAIDRIEGSRNLEIQMVLWLAKAG